MFLGLQDASRKRTEVSRTLGKWAGTLVETSGDRPSSLILNKQLMKWKDILVRIREEAKERGYLNHEQLEKDRIFGFFCLERFGACVSISKGYIRLWIRGGWEVTKMGGTERREMILYLASKEGEVEISEESVAPKGLFPIVRRKSNLQALNFLLEGDEPTRIPC